MVNFLPVTHNDCLELAKDLSSSPFLYGSNHDSNFNVHVYYLSDYLSEYSRVYMYQLNLYSGCNSCKCS